jgi:hypothetical protein
MKNMLLIAAAAAAAAAALAGCQKAADTSNETTAPVASNSATPGAMATANGSGPGTYDVTAKDGTKTQSILNGDGSYSDLDATGKVTAKGTWNVTAGKTCFDPEGAEGPACYAETAVGPDGSFTATSDKGEVLTVKRVS